MSFNEVMKKKLYYMFSNKALPYVSTEGEAAIKAYELELTNEAKINAKKANKKRKKVTGKEATGKRGVDVKKRTKIIVGVLSLVVLVFGAVIYKKKC